MTLLPCKYNVTAARTQPGVPIFIMLILYVLCPVRLSSSNCSIFTVIMKNASWKTGRLPIRNQYNIGDRRQNAKFVPILQYKRAKPSHLSFSAHCKLGDKIVLNNGRDSNQISCDVHERRQISMHHSASNIDNSRRGTGIHKADETSCVQDFDADHKRSLVPPNRLHLQDSSLDKIDWSLIKSKP